MQCTNIYKKYVMHIYIYSYIYTYTYIYIHTTSWKLTDPSYGRGTFQHIPIYLFSLVTKTVNNQASGSRSIPEFAHRCVCVIPTSCCRRLSNPVTRMEKLGPTWPQKKPWGNSLKNLKIRVAFYLSYTWNDELIFGDRKQICRWNDHFEGCFGRMVG